MKTTEEEREAILRKYIGKPTLFSIVKKQFDFFADSIETLLPYLHVAIENKVLVRELVQVHHPKLLKKIKVAFKLGKPFLRKGFGDEVTAYFTTRCLLDLYGDEIKEKVDENLFGGWILYNCQDLRKTFYI